MITGHFFILDADSLKDGIHIFRYKQQYVGKENSCIYLSFTNDGVRFFLREEGESSFFSGCILFLPFTPEFDIRFNISLIINALLLTESENFESLMPANQEFDAKNRYSFSPSKNHNGKQIGMTFLGQLLLDFIYEMHHSSLFAECPLYFTASERLLSNPLYAAIANKAEYGLHLHRYINPDEKDELTVDKFIRAERRWVETIVNPHSERMFHESPWFDDSAVEMDAVYNNDNACLEIRTDDKTGDENDVNVIEETANIAMEWYLSKYKLDGLLKIRFGTLYKTPMQMAAIFFSLLAILGIVYCCSYNALYSWKYLCCWNACARTLLLVFAMIPAITYICCSYKKKNRHKLFKYKTLPNAFMPRLFASIFAGWMTIGLSDLVANGHKAYENYALYSLVLLIPTLIYLFFSVNKLLPYERILAKAIISIVIVSISMVYSMIAGWFLLLIYGDASYLFGDDVSKENPGILLVFSIIAVFVGIFIQMLFRNKSVSSLDE